MGRARSLGKGQSACICKAGCLFSLFLRLDLNIYKHPRDRVAHPLKELLEKRKRLALVFLFGVFLGIAAQMNSLTQMIEGS